MASNPPRRRDLKLPPDTRTPEDFPPEVHYSLAVLQEEAVVRGGIVRKATEDECALARLQRRPNHCNGFARRTGLPCRRARVKGATMCIQHGANLQHVKDARDRRLMILAGPALGEMAKLAMLPIDPKTARVKQEAAADILDRAGVGALVEAKVRASYRGQPLSGVTVQIGFLQTMDGASDQPLLPAADVIDAEATEAQGDCGAGDRDSAVAAEGGDSAQRGDPGGPAAAGDGSGGTE